MIRELKAGSPRDSRKRTSEQLEGPLNFNKLPSIDGVRFVFKLCQCASFLDISRLPFPYFSFFGAPSVLLHSFICCLFSVYVCVIYTSRNNKFILLSIFLVSSGWSLQTIEATTCGEKLWKLIFERGTLVFFNLPSLLRKTQMNTAEVNHRKHIHLDTGCANDTSNFTSSPSPAVPSPFHIAMHRYTQHQHRPTQL